MRETIKGFVYHIARPVVAGWLAAFVAIAALVVPELLLLLAYSGLNAIVDLGRVLGVFLLVGLIYAFFCEALFLVVRFFAAVLTHIERVFPPSVPGMVVFVVLSQPLLALEWEEGGAALRALQYAFVIALSFGLGTLVVYLLPDFRGHNASFVLAAAILARLILAPYEPPLSEVLLFYVFLLSLVCLTGLGYAVIQMRYRLLLGAGYESFHIPSSAMRVGWFVAAIVMLLLLVASWTFADQGGSIFGMLRSSSIGDHLRVPAPLFFVLLIHWMVGAMFLRSAPETTEENRIHVNRGGLAIGGTIVISVVAFMISFHVLAGGVPARLVAANGISGEFLAMAGYIMDSDEDGNSRWPATDPDDHDPCARQDFVGGCDSLEQSSNIAGPPVRSIVVVTLAGYHPPPTAPGSTERVGRLLLATDDVPRSLRALWQDLNGISEYRGANGSAGLLRTFLSNRYRTICVGREDTQNSFRPHSELGLDAGCQILRVLEKEEAGSLDSVVAAAIAEHARYRERRTLMWIHRETDRPEEVPADFLERVARETRSSVLVVFIPPDTEPVAMYRSRGSIGEVPPFPHAGDLVLSLAGARLNGFRTTNDQITVLHHQPFARSYAARLRDLWTEDRLPVFTARVEDGRFVVIDGLTGAKWKSKESLNQQIAGRDQVAAD